MAVARITTPAYGANAAFGSTATVNVNTTGGSLLLALLVWNHATNLVSGVTFNGVGMTHLFSNTVNQRKFAVYYKNGGLGATADVVATWDNGFASANTARVQVVVLSGSHATSPFGTTNSKNAGSGTSIVSDSVTTADANGLFISLLSKRDFAEAHSPTGTGHTAFVSEFGIEPAFACGERAGSATGVTMGYSWTTTAENALGIIPINAAAAGGLPFITRLGAKRVA